MTNKTELMPCPFCGGEAEFLSGGTAEFYGHDHQGMSVDCNKCGMSMTLDTCMDKNGETSKGYEFGCSCCNDISSILRKRWNTRAAPAEDVRAVGDEPVMRLECEKLWGGNGEYAVDFVKSGWLDECRKKGGKFLLYHQPQRPVVLPERRAVSEHARDQAMCANAWNACIDEFKMLNP